MTVSLLEILGAARSHAAPLAAESAGYLLLAVTDQLVSAPRVVQPDEVELSADGAVRLRARREGAGVAERAEPALRRLLARTLEVSSSVGPGLRRAAERRDSTGLTALVRELETALIPVNRSAAKRALSRLHRETERARDSGKLAAAMAAEAALSEPATAARLASEPVSAPVERSELPPPASLPVVAAVPAAAPRPAPPVELTLTPEPRPVDPEPVLTKPEPVVQRARERAGSTPRLGTLVTAQTLASEEAELTERVPSLQLDEEPELERALELDPEPELELPIDVELEADAELTPSLHEAAARPVELAPKSAADDDEDADDVTPLRALAVAPQPLLDPEPSRLPDVVTAMFELHTGMPADEEPTRLREVVTELLAVVQPVPLVTPAPLQVEDEWLQQSSLEAVVTSSSLFVSELAEPELHEAKTWNPGPVEPLAAALPPDSLLISEPAPEPSPYVPARLPSASSDVSELLDSFHVSSAAEEGELRSALKEMAGLELTPLPHPLIEER